MSDKTKDGIKGLLVTISVAVIGALGGWFSSYVTLKSTVVQTESSREEKYLDTIISESEKLRDLVGVKDAEIRELHTSMRELQGEVSKLRASLANLEATELPKDAKQLIELIMNEMPYPAWLHEVGKNNWYINDTYSDIFGVNRANFWTPINILRRYPSDISAQYLSNDMQVIEARKGAIFQERVTRNVLFPEGPGNPSMQWDVLKIPMLVEGKGYIFGASVNNDTPDNIFAKYRQ